MTDLFMREPFIEIVPNFSEGRNKAIIKKLVDRVHQVKDAGLLDQHIDPDHNRTVLTIVGRPEGVKEVAWRLVETACQCIDIRKHDGVHPRVGAIDVLPCIPLGQATMQDCVHLAGVIGERVGRKWSIPVFLYEAAATHPMRHNLANIRQGGPQALQARMLKHPNWFPDFGPKELHPSAGALAIGARSFLIAFNVNLKTATIDVARIIASKIREVNGGLPALKAIGLSLSSQGFVQVSMNITDFHRTSLQQAFETVREEAAKSQIAIAGCEIVGLIPRAAITMCSEEFQRLLDVQPQQILENRLDLITKMLG